MRPTRRNRMTRSRIQTRWQSRKSDFNPSSSSYGRIHLAPSRICPRAPVWNEGRILWQSWCGHFSFLTLSESSGSAVSVGHLHLQMTIFINAMQSNLNLGLNVLIGVWTFLITLSLTTYISQSQQSCGYYCAIKIQLIGIYSFN